MKILVVSDSHGGKSFMRLAVKAVRPDAIIHLGDYYEDGVCLEEENPRTPVYQVPGNCDKYRVFDKSEILCCSVCGVRMYLTHGHLHKVKQGMGALICAARQAQVEAVLYGHTHQAACERVDGLWVLNPGSCGGYGGSVGVISADNGKITSCEILCQEELLALQGE